MRENADVSSDHQIPFVPPDCSTFDFREPIERNVEKAEVEASLKRRSQRLAHANSVPRIASPSGITMIAGPGMTTSTTPMSKTVNPMTKITTRLAVRKTNTSHP